VRFIHAGCGVNALSGLQDRANSIYCMSHVGLISVAHQAVLRLPALLIPGLNPAL
jgi:potassium efflux system protein